MKVVPYLIKEAIVRCRFQSRLASHSRKQIGKEKTCSYEFNGKNPFEQVTAEQELVFPSPGTGERLNDIKKSFCKATADAGIEDFRFHDLRHTTAATRMADAGADAFTLAKILGHSNIQMTARYTHATDTAIRRAVENLDVSVQFSNVLATEKNRQTQGLP